MFFIVIYIHIARGLYYGSFAKPRYAVWTIGVVILILMMATAFMGYVCLGVKWAYEALQLLQIYLAHFL
jgi:quinol-cytochrome oxidoreductase complex cytochrome b subunit